MSKQSQVIAPPSPVPEKVAHGPRAILAVLSLAAFMASLDVFIVNVAFDRIGASFHGASIGDVSWVLNAYAIVFAALLVPLGRLADRIGRKSMFSLGLGLFTAASVACAVAPGLWWLVAFRVLQAAGAAALTPTSLGLLLAAVPAEKRMPYVRIWSAVAGIAAAAGPVLGGLLVTASWRWVFLVNLPVGIVALVAVARVVPDSRDADVSKVPDMIGAAALTAGIGALALAIVKGGDWGWGSGGTIASFAVAALLLAEFVRRAEHHPVPLVEPDLYRVRTFAAANIAMITFSIGFAGFLLTLVLWLQNVWHWSTITTGLAVAPGPAVVPVVTVLIQRYARRVRPGVLTALGCLAFAAGIVTTLSLVGPHGADYAGELLPGELVSGLGIALALPTLLASATAGLPAHRTSTGSGVITMTRQIGYVLGVSILVAVLGTPTSYDAAHRAFVHGWWTIAAVEVAAAAACLGIVDRRKQPATPATP
ncbi:MFS transporter [Actinacidiphila acididurans]|uniref:MFS transporter n=1 Tax=Actinacidiphila acididurans TaxID=2784346 RepID=A0ABS2TT15_9ACTN|nr:MFS transporter [Actinacidiphila acididurans]MBM9506217.1 MFS transporter [Actinacidiphila acididurans]